MAKFYFCIVAMVTLGAVSSNVVTKPEHVPGIPQARVLLDAAEPAPEPECEADKSGLFCAACSTLLFCANGKTQGKFKCVDSDPSTPYCVNSQCVAKKEEGNPECEDVASSSLECTFSGYVPDPDDCTVYHYCEEPQGEPSDTYKCPSGYVYDSSKNMCKQEKTENDCATIKCEQGKQFAVYESDKSIFALCDSESNRPTIFRCHDPNNQWFDKNSGFCRYVCKKEGPFEDIDDPNKYYVCYLVNNEWVLSHEKCPGTQEFDAENPPCKKKESSGTSGGANAGSNEETNEEATEANA